MFLELDSGGRSNGPDMARTASDLESGDAEAARFLRAVDRSIEPAQPRIGGAPVTLPARALAVGVFDRRGGIVARDARFADWFDADEAAEAASNALRGGGGPVLAPLATCDGATTVILAASIQTADAWPLPDEARTILTAAPGAFAVIGYRPFEDRHVAGRALDSWRLTPLEARVMLGLISGGDLVEAARRAGCGYETARKALKLALRKAGAARQADLVRLLHAAVGGGDLQLDQAPALAAALGLSERAASACVLLALGLTRSEAAATLRISEHTIKDELKLLFDRFDLRSATDLSRLTTEAVVLMGLAANPNMTVGASWGALRPLRFVNRPDGAGKIALSDFGPTSGEPVLLFHTATTGSLLDRGLVRALHARGLRPIAIERPGFGLTDPPLRDGPETAVDDVLAVMDAFDLKRVRILARGGEYLVMMLGQRCPERLQRVVLVNPFTPYAFDSRWDGFLNGAKRTFMRHPHLIEPLARFLAQRASPKVYERLTRDALKGSAPDTALMTRAEVVDDYVESARLAPLKSTWGFVFEQRNYLTWAPPPLADGARWTRLIGAHDVLYRPGDADALWEAALPGHRRVCVEDGGRFLHASHPDLVAEELLLEP
ncbi:alpha/beta hydrolase [Phenylobacterium sp.]|uniref:alpha/beta hydrolase n=1 Tax=Phenylobacterium sp. TaxID=1871053 RepID=UPI00301B8FF1